jgi:hypothetical protein
MQHAPITLIDLVFQCKVYLLNYKSVAQLIGLYSKNNKSIVAYYYTIIIIIIIIAITIKYL